MSKALVGGKLSPPERTGQRGSCPKCGEEVRAPLWEPRWYWQHVELSGICHLPDEQRLCCSAPGRLITLEHIGALAATGTRPRATHRDQANLAEIPPGWRAPDRSRSVVGICRAATADETPGGKEGASPTLLLIAGPGGGPGSDKAEPRVLLLTPSRPENKTAGNERNRIGMRRSEPAGEPAFCLVKAGVQVPLRPPLRRTAGCACGDFSCRKGVFYRSAPTSSPLCPV